MTQDEIMMSLCINEAWKYQTLALKNPSVGSMIVDKNGKILSLEVHNHFGNPHAEVKALKKAYEILTQKQCPFDSAIEIHQFLKANHQNIFNDCIIYVTLEPCNHYGKTPPCAELLENIKPKKIIIGAIEENQEASGGIKRLEKAGIEIISNVCNKEAKDLLYPFQRLKNTGHFNLFKIAQRLNGDYKSGKISSESSQIFTHNQRSIIDSLIISGNTIRNDLPTLDSRFSENKKSPNIKILSHQKKFDLKIPMFSIPNREIKIYNEISELGLESGFNLIEGGWELFKNLYKYIDMLLLHISPTLKNGIQNHDFLFDGELLKTQKLGNDALLWIKKS